MQIERLSNTEKKLSFQAMRQLYIACIFSVADYEVPIWWNNQKHLLEKFQKLQNQILRKILDTFKISSISVMKIEASISSSKVRFNRICKNYALRILQMHERHSIRLRVSSSFSSFSNEIELDWSQFLDWNETENSQHSHVYSELSTSSSKRRKRRKISKKKQVSQLFRITASIANLLSSLKTETISHKEDTSWKESLNSLININISELSKEKEAIQHKNLIQKLIKYQNINNIIIYSDDSKNEKTSNLDADIFYTKNFATENSKSLSWNLNSHMKVFDAELFAIEKAFKLALDQMSFYTKDIWVFSDSQAAIQRIQKSDVNADQSYVLAIENWTAKIKAKYQVNIHLSWISEHMNIKDNELADQAAKKETELQKISIEKYVFFSFIKRKIKESALLKWQKEYIVSAREYTPGTSRVD